jgi:hypothetical protein
MGRILLQSSTDKDGTKDFNRYTALFKKKRPIKKKEKSINANKRMKEILIVEKFLKEKAGNPQTQDEEKIEIDHQLKLLALEKEDYG